MHFVRHASRLRPLRGTAALIPLLVVALAGFAALATTKAARAELPTSTTAAVDELTVRLRVVHEVAPENPTEFGSGLIVGGTSDEITVLTALHVVKESLASPKKRVQAKLPGMSTWIDCRRAGPLNEATGSDIAFVVVPTSRGQECDALCKRVIALSAPADGVELAALGADPAKDSLAWRTALCRGESADAITFDGDEIVPGYSGGPLVAASGIVGITSTAGPGGKGHTAVSLVPALGWARAKSLPVTMAANLADVCLRRLEQDHLVAAMDVWDLKADNRGVPGWAALAIKSRTGATAVLDAISCKARCDIQMSVEGAGFSLHVGKDFPTRAQVSVTLRAGSYTFKPDPNIAIPGLVIFTSEASERNVRIHVALPSTATELLAARSLYSAATSGGAAMKGAPFQAFHVRELPHVAGVRSPFSLQVDHDWYVDVKVDIAQHRGRPFKIVGDLCLPDAGKDKRTDPKQVAAWEALRLTVTTPQAGGELAGTPIGWKAVPISLTVNPPPEPLIRVGNTAPPGRGNYGSLQLLARQFRLVYEDKAK